MNLQPRHLLMAPIKAYRLLLSPWLGSQCRFEPTCSVYALQALECHGAVKGTALMGWRLLRCHPWCQGGHDPVPLPAAPSIASLPAHSAARQPGSSADPHLATPAPEHRPERSRT